VLNQEKTMKHPFKSSQRGVTFLGMLVVGGLLAVTGVVLAQVLPTLLEYQAVNKAVNRAKEGGTVPDVRNLFDKAAQIDDIKSISGKDLEITKEGDKVVIRFAYEREIHLTGPAWLTLKYTGRSK
jgi:sensor histidine kinase regulating citrate/malate metabolism